MFVSDGAKCDTGNFQELFATDIQVAIPDPVYPVYLDTNVMAGRTGDFENKRLLIRTRFGMGQCYIKGNCVSRIFLAQDVGVAWRAVLPGGGFSWSTPRRAEQFMLTQIDPVHQEFEMARCSSAFGTTSFEYRKRIQKAEKMCEPLLRKINQDPAYQDPEKSKQAGIELACCLERYKLNLSPKQALYYVKQRNKCRKEQRTEKDCWECFGRAYGDAKRLAK